MGEKSISIFGLLCVFGCDNSAEFVAGGEEKMIVDQMMETTCESENPN